MTAAPLVWTVDIGVSLFGPAVFGSKEAPGRLSVTMRKVFEWESGLISKRHARRTVWPQVVFHTASYSASAGDGHRTAPAGRARRGAETMRRRYDRLHIDYGAHLMTRNKIR